MRQLVTKKEFADKIGKTKQYVGKLCARGLPVDKNGKVPLQAGLDWYKANVIPADPKRRQRKPRESSPVQPEVPETLEGLAEDITRAEADRRLTLAKAELAELELLKERGVLVEANSVTEAWGGMISAAKARALLIPSSLATRIARESDPLACEAMLKQEIDLMLFELSDYRDAQQSSDEG